MSDYQGPESQCPQRRLYELDGMRGLAALSVLVAHFNPSPWSVAGTVAAPIFLMVNDLAIANLGVAFFFVLSAWLLSWISARELDRSGRIGLIHFYSRRIFRIWPLYFLTMATAFVITAPLSPLSGATPDLGPTSWHWAVDHLWVYVMFLSNWSLAVTFIGGHVDPSAAPLRVLWSIAVEEQFYLLFPLVLPFALSNRGRTAAVGSAVVIAAVVFRAVFMMVPVDRPSVSSSGLYYTSLAYADMLLWGSVAGVLYARRHPLLHYLSSGRWRGLIGLILLLATGVIGILFRRQLWYPYAWYTPPIYGVVGLLFAILILWVVSNPTALVPSLLRSRVGRVLGSLSFGIYLWHEIVGTTLRGSLAWLSPSAQASDDFPVLLFFLAYLGLTLLASALSYVLVERPFLRLKDRRFPHR